MSSVYVLVRSEEQQTTLRTDIITHIFKCAVGLLFLFLLLKTDTEICFIYLVTLLRIINAF